MVGGFSEKPELILGELGYIKREEAQQMLSLFSCGERIRTNDLWVMSPTSYPCSTPRCFDDAKVVLFLYTANFLVTFLRFFVFFLL